MEKTNSIGENFRRAVIRTRQPTSNQGGRVEIFDLEAEAVSSALWVIRHLTFPPLCRRQIQTLEHWYYFRQNKSPSRWQVTWGWSNSSP